MKKKRKQPKITIINHFKTTDKDKLSEIITQKMSNIINNKIRDEILKNEIYSNSDPDGKE